MSENNAAKRIAEAIRKEFIAHSGAKVGDRLPSVRELSEKYGASSHTVVHALELLVVRGSAEKRRGSGCYIADGNGVDEKLARGGDVNILGLVLPDTRAEIMTRISRGVEKACAVQDWRLMIACCEQDYDTERKCLDKLRADGCKGIVIYPSMRIREQMAHDHIKTEFRDYQLALIDLAYPDQRHIQVVFDNRRLGRDMTDVLLKQGHRRVAFTDFGDSEYRDAHKSTHDRYLGYIDAMTAAGLRVYSEDHWMLRRTPDKGAPELIAPALIKWTQSRERPTALIAIDDSVAVEIITVAVGLGISVPDDLEVVGFDNTRESTACSNMTWTSDPDFSRAGEMAAELLIERIRNNAGGASFAYVLPAPVKQCRSQLLVERCRNAIECSCEDLGLDVEQFSAVR
ncbi:MAG: GntR family transcriptional regulator [Armatimonadota bacterium]